MSRFNFNMKSFMDKVVQMNSSKVVLTEKIFDDVTAYYFSIKKNSISAIKRINHLFKWHDHYPTLVDMTDLRLRVNVTNKGFNNYEYDMCIEGVYNDTMYGSYFGGTVYSDGKVKTKKDRIALRKLMNYLDI